MLRGFFIDHLYLELFMISRIGISAILDPAMHDFDLFHFHVMHVLMHGISGA